MDLKLRNTIKHILGDNLSTKLKHASVIRKQKRMKKVPFGGDDLVFVLRDVCRVKKGDVLFIHSSIDGLLIDASARWCVELLMDLVGTQGTILMSSYPRLSSYEFLRSGEVWDVRKTPSYTGIMTEIFRRMEDSRRSLHPTKSVAVWGAFRDELISEHHKDIRPYSIKSPYFKFVEMKGKAIGIGVSADYMAFAHSVDDYLGDDFPVDVYHKEVFKSEVINYEGDKIIVHSLAHDLNKMRYETVGFIRRYLPKGRGDSFSYKSRSFFYVDAKAFFDTAIELARQGTTIYKKSVYRYR